MSTALRRRFERLVAPAGIVLDGHRPWDPQIHDERFFRRVLTTGSLGLGESYMDGWWECERLDEMIHRALRARLDRRLHAPTALVDGARNLLVNLQSRARAFVIGERHYDLGNDLFEAMLDQRMIYSCALWREANDLDHAQEKKVEWIARKLHLEPGQRVLDIGCGWGGTAKFLAERYGVHVVGITVSQEQQRYARELCRELPVEIRLGDYRELDERFDRIVSVGMIEHVGYRNYAAYFDVVRRCLDPEGVFVLQTIGSRRSARACNPWIERFIFPNSILPSAKRLTAAMEGRVVLEDWEEFGSDYDHTLMAWHANFESAWPELSRRYDERFRRMWRFYLLSCAGAFRARSNQLWQIVVSRDGILGGYEAPGREKRRSPRTAAATRSGDPSDAGRDAGAL